MKTTLFYLYRRLIRHRRRLDRVALALRLCGSVILFIRSLP